MSKSMKIFAVISVVLSIVFLQCCTVETVKYVDPNGNEIVKHEEELRIHYRGVKCNKSWDIVDITYINCDGDSVTKAYIVRQGGGMTPLDEFMKGETEEKSSFSIFSDTAAVPIDVSAEEDW